ncbi:hypothetical protein LEUCIP111803_00802 [Leucobacter soli]|uniref:PucR family transcriptional regulator n=2 Tax=Leucobacter soli TaxID=2812850 RepID=A0A916JW53_9MICO|nr:hypothetical protein LEUCIP111803_00802 [Leucobacter soli]
MLRMPRIVDEIIRKPEFGIEVLARNSELEPAVVCRGVQVTEHVDPSPWLHRLEIVLTTGISLTTEAQQQAFVEKLVASKALALIYSAYSGELVPERVIEVCRQHGLTLLRPSPVVPLADMAAFINRRILDGHFATQQTSIKLYRQLVALVIRGASIQKILDTVLDILDFSQTMIIDREGIVLAETGQDPEILALMKHTIRSYRRNARGAGQSFQLPFDQSLCNVIPVQLDGSTHAFIAIVSSRALNEHEELMLEQLHAGVALTLSRDLTDNRWRQQSFTRLLEAVHMGEMSSVLVQERLRAANIDEAVEGVLFRVECETDGSHLAQLIRVLENELIGFTDTVAFHEGAVYFFVPDPSERLGEEIYRSLSPLRNPKVIASMRHSGADGFVRAYQEVNMLAQQQLNSVGFFAAESMDTLTILRSNHDPMLRALVARALGPLFDANGREKPELLHTLETFIRSGCRTGPTAEELHVHRHTVTYRLNQITQLVGLDPRSGDSLLEYTAALRLYRAGVVKCEDITDRTR